MTSKIMTEENIYSGNQGTARHYLGMVFGYADGWTHSLQAHGAAKLATRGDAVSDLIATRTRLPAAVYRILYGEVTR